MLLMLRLGIQKPFAFRVMKQLETYRLTSGSTSSSSNGYVIAVDLSDLDLLGIKSTFNLEDNTYITIQASAIDDTLGNDVL